MNGRVRNWVKGASSSYKAFNFVDGEGIRNSLYVAAACFTVGLLQCGDLIFQCRHSLYQELEEQIMADLAQPYVQGLTLAGEPFLNTGILLPLVKRVRVADKDIWSWTGYRKRNDARDTRQARAYSRWLIFWSMAAMIRVNATSCCSFVAFNSGSLMSKKILKEGVKVVHLGQAQWR